MKKKKVFNKEKIKRDALWNAEKTIKCSYFSDNLPDNLLVVDGSVRKKNNSGVGVGEIKGIELKTGKIIFQEILNGEVSSNMAEYIAIYKASLWCELNNKEMIIFSDSTNAIIWSKSGKSNPQIHSNSNSIRLLQLKADSHFTNTKKKIYYWNKKIWGENPADFGRKNKK